MREDDPKEMGAPTRRRWRRTNPIAARSTLRTTTLEGPWMIDFAPWRSRATVRSPEGPFEVRGRRGVFELIQDGRVVASAYDWRGALRIESASGQEWTLADEDAGSSCSSRVIWQRPLPFGEEELDTELPAEAPMTVHALAAATACLDRPAVTSAAILAGCGFLLLVLMSVSQCLS